MKHHPSCGTTAMEDCECAALTLGPRGPARSDSEDARRYRWLLRRAEKPWVNSPDMVRLHIIEPGQTLDDAIDARMSEELTRACQAPNA